MTLNDFRRIFQLPQATNNNHERFAVAPKFSEIALFFLNNLVTGHDQPPLQIMQMLYCFVNNVHVDYAELLWEGLHYAVEHPSTLIPYPRFTKLIVGHYMTAFPEISRRVHDKYHNLEHDEMVKSIFNSGKNKARVGMKIPSWMIIDEMKLTENYWMYAEAFGVDVPTTRSQPIESTQGTHRTTSAPRSPNPDVDEGESSAQRKFTVRLRIPPRQSTRLTPPTPVLTIAEVEDITLRDTIQLSLAEQKRTKNDDANEVDTSIPNSQNDPGTRLDPGSYKESPEVEKITDVQPVNVIEEEEKSAEDDYELRRREKGKDVEETRNTPTPTPTRSTRIHYNLVSLDTEKL
ncbi:hypothetical protein Tco_1328004 [Tanacetum coccineum]